MSNVALFISPEIIKQDVYVDENTDNKYLVNAISIAQELYIKTIIGSGVYNEIATQILSSTLSTNNNTLLTTYIQPALKYWTLFEAIDMLNFKISNKTVGIKNSDNTQPASLDDLVYLKNKFRNIAEWKTERIRLYLLANTLLFPLFLNPGSTIDTIYPKGNSYNSGMYLGKSKNKNCNGTTDKYEYPGSCCE